MACDYCAYRYSYGYDDGWNSLRKKILGEDEENK